MARIRCLEYNVFLSMIIWWPLTLGASSVAARAASRDDAGWSGSRKIPPAWQTDNDRQRSRPRSMVRPWYLPRLSVGVGLNFPEVLPIETHLSFGRYFALRAFYSPTLPFNIRVEMPSDVISTKNQLAVANPEFTIRLKARYGPSYGLEGMIFPFGKSFFVSAGTSFRAMRLSGSARSPVLVCSKIEAAIEPPCGREDASITTKTQLDIRADVKTTAVLWRGSLGWFWHVGDAGYFSLSTGFTKPTRIVRDADVRANLIAPTSQQDEVEGALAQIKEERQKDLETKAKKEMRPVDEKTLPILGISAGIRF